MISLPVETEVITERRGGPAPASPRKHGRIPELDGVRGIAIILVLLLHGFAWSMQTEKWTGLARWAELATRPGGMGVDLFFVLSGFLITGILLDSRGKPHYFRNFYARRALRILPLYYLILFLIAICYRGAHGYVELGAFYLSNMAPIFGVAVLYGPLWSLSVEEHFYLLWPWLISRLKPNRIWLLAAGLCVAEPLLRGVAFFEGWNVGEYSWFRFDGLAAGALLAMFVRSRWDSERRLLALGALCIAATAVLAVMGFPFGIYTRKRLMGDALLFTLYAVLFTGFMALVLSGAFRRLSALMRSRALRRCGELSYFLYIAHWLIFYGWDSFVGKYPAVLTGDLGRFGALCIRALTVYVVCFILAELSQRYFEGPLLRMKRFFEYPSAAGTPHIAAPFMRARRRKHRGLFHDLLRQSKFPAQRKGSSLSFMLNSLKRLSYRPEVVKPIQKLGLSAVLRRAYFQLAKPANGILETEVAGIPARFYARTPEELRILESGGGAGGEERVLDALVRFLQPGDVVADIGANVGLYSVLLARKVGSQGLVIACEPGGRNFRHLGENLKLNGLENVRPFRKALGDMAGKAKLYASAVIGNSSLAGGKNGSGAAEEVEVIEGDRLIAQENLPVPRALKIDVEGFEYAVLRGFERTLRDPACQLVTCEVHPSLLPENIAPEMILGLLEACGFANIQTCLRWDKTFHVVAGKKCDA